MKRKSYAIMASILTSAVFSQFASPASLTATCTNVNKDSESDSVLKVTVNDDWKNAFVSPVDMPNVVIALSCSPKTLDEQDFQQQCTVDLFNVPGVIRGWMTFTKYNADKMDLVTTVVEGDDSRNVASGELFECVKD